jgi:predicted phage tail protein
MKLIGVLLMVGGWLLPIAGLTWTSSLAVRFILCLIGISVILVGILGFLNPAYVKDAVWKK